MAKKNEEVIEIRSIEEETVAIRIVGTTPLISHAWSEKAKRMMLDAMTGKKKGKAREIKNPVDDFIRSMYWLTPMPEDGTEEAFEKAIEEGARFGFPATAIKQASISAAYRKGWAKDKMSLRGAFFMPGMPPLLCTSMRRRQCQGIYCDAFQPWYIRPPAKELHSLF